MKTLRCTKCKKNKPVDDFHKHTGFTRGYQYYCKPCNWESKKKWKEENPERSRLTSYKYEIRRQYGLEWNEYEKILANQFWSCAICQLDIDDYFRPYFDVDHCHKTGKVRGLLCHRCNKGLGCFDDEIWKIKESIKYLEKNGDLL